MPIRSNYLGPVTRALLGGLLALLALASAAAPAAAQETRRLALVIGNGSYRTVPPLPNARNDADATAEMLQEARFEVSRLLDTDLAALRSGVERFSAAVERAGQGAVAVVYYAGHAVQLNGNNHLLPVDVRPTADSDLPAQSVTLGEILKRLDRTGAVAKLVILDACRDNPFETSVAPARGLAVALLDNPGKAEAGLARVESKGGTFVAFATSPGTSAADGAGRHSPFTEALLRYAREPGAPVEAVFRKVRIAVHEATDGLQTPWETSSLTKHVSFFEPTSERSQSLHLASQGTGPSSTRGAEIGLGPEPTRDSLKAMSPEEAYTLVISWDRPEHYRLFLDVWGEDPLALRIHRILSVRIEEMSWAMAARWGDPAHLRRYASVFSGSAHALEARAMAAAGGAPGAKTAVCTPALPQGIIDQSPVLRRASLKLPATKSGSARNASVPRTRAQPVEPELEEIKTYGAPLAVVEPFTPGIIVRREQPRPPALAEPGRPSRPVGGSLPQIPEDTYSPGFARFIDAGRTRAGIPPTVTGSGARPVRPQEKPFPVRGYGPGTGLR